MAEKSLSIEDFCEAEDICRMTFYNLKTRGEGPDVYYVGRSVRISPEAHRAWRAARIAARQPA